MLKEAIEKIQEITKPFIADIDGHSFAVSAGQVQEIMPEVFTPEGITLHSLDALVTMAATEAAKIINSDDILYIEVFGHDVISAFTQPKYGRGEAARVCLYDVRATDVPGWESRQTFSFEEALIALRTRFQETPDTNYALKLLSDITTGAKVTFNDNGVATSVVTKRGVDLQSNEAIRPIVSLRPYRTFQEVEQPVSPFLIRVNDRGITFIEADGGMWKLAARQTVKAYLEEKLADVILDGKVRIML